MSITAAASREPRSVVGMKFPPFEHEFGHDAQDLLVRLGNARGVKVLADFAEQVTALGIDRAPGKVVRTGIGVPARACQFLSGPPAEELVAEDRPLHIV